MAWNKPRQCTVDAHAADILSTTCPLPRSHTCMRKCELHIKFEMREIKMIDPVAVVMMCF